ncbi:MAG: T9SS type A sorting domain-containing protein [Saprospiraceae bacterium]|nr:T9SS type A sorting domain-containing protein [Saprospiraceae bacterium]MBK9222744.1 T9SS type A sorting domain-containing protein [Saprospiraceae bacterium]
MNRFIRNGMLAFVTLFWVLGFVSSVQAQNAVTMYLVDQGWVGDTNIIELRCTQFQNISAMQFSLKEENNLGRFISMDQINIPNFSVGSNTFYNTSNSTLTVTWDVPFIFGLSIPDGQVLFRFRWQSNPALKHCYKMVESPTPVEIIDAATNTLNVKLFSSCDPFLAIPSFFNAYYDINKSCTYETQEPIFSHYTIIDSFNNQVFIYKNPQQLFYSKSEFGLHHFSVIPETPVWSACNQNQIQLIDSTTKFLSFNYGIQSIISCPQLQVEIQTPVVRRCIDYQYYIQYSNKGTIPELNTKIRIKLDPYMQFISSSIPVSLVQLPYVEFNVGNLDVFQSGNFSITVNIDCATTQVGQTHCVSAEILPKYDCFTSPNWSGASIKLDARCENGKAKFRIQNTGAQNMLESTQYWIVEDDIMPGLKKDIKLNAGQFQDFEYPANGTCYRLIADQVKNHPGHSQPTLALEACGRNTSGTFSTGYFLMFAEDEEDPNIAIDCQASRGSFDPNDKIGMPLGYGPEQFVDLQRSIDYKIRFQNTGNDTAFRVVIVDTLSEWMDLRSLKILDASHPFSFSLINRVLSFRFDPIYLPYKSIDEEKSNGYVNYSIQSKVNAPLKSKILNEASIYFDFNAPILTNTTIHTLAKDFIIVSVEPADPENTIVNIYPNPGTDFITIESEHLSPEKDFILYDLLGHEVMHQKLFEKFSKIKLSKYLKSGIYLIKIVDSKNTIFNSRIEICTKN